MRNKVIISISFAFLLFSCSRETEESKNEIIAISEFPNPTHILMKSVGKKTLISVDSITGIGDTISFDDDGRLYLQNGYEEMVRYSYDSNGFITRRLFVSDYIENSHVVNRYAKDTIIQSWYRLKHPNWEYEEDDYLSDQPFRIVKFVVENGLIVRSFTNNDVVTEFEYDGQNKLLNETHKRDGELWFYHSYNYDKEDGKLTLEMKVQKGDTIYVKRFENDLLKEIESEFGSEYGTYVQTFKEL